MFGNIIDNWRKPSPDWLRNLRSFMIAILVPLTPALTESGMTDHGIKVFTLWYGVALVVVEYAARSGDTGQVIVDKSDVKKGVDIS